MSFGVTNVAEDALFVYVASFFFDELVACKFSVAAAASILVLFLEVLPDVEG